MILLSDNDIVLKLAGCGLLNQFFEILEAESQDILIATNAGYALPKQAKRKLKNDDAIEAVNQFVKDVGRVPVVDSLLLGAIQDFNHMDGGESLLMIAAHENPAAYLATGDKRCLRSLIDNQFSEPLNHVFKSLQQRVYCLETALMLLIEKTSYDIVNKMVINRCVEDGVLGIAFGQERDNHHAIECLKSYCRDLSPLLVPMPCLSESLA